MSLKYAFIVIVGFFAIWCQFAPLLKTFSIVKFVPPSLYFFISVHLHFSITSGLGLLGLE